jgi:hypothetical protein
MIPKKRELPRRQPLAAQGRKCSTASLAPLRNDDKLWELVFASWARAIRRAPIENRPKLLFMMSRDAAAWAAAHRQQAIDDVWQVADELGLIALLGATSVQAAIAAGFDGGQP